MSKFTSTAIAICIGAVVIWYQYGNQTDSSSTKPVENITSKTSEPVSTRKSPVKDPNIPTRLSTGVDMFLDNSPSVQGDESWLDEKDTIVWQLSEQAEKILKDDGHIPADVNNEVYVELDVKELLSVEVGEYMDLYIPQINGSYTGEVDYITEHENGDRTIEAHIPGAGNLYSAVITLGDNAVYGTLGTQDDVYLMEGNGQYAWIASKSDLVAKHSKTHVDAIIPNGTETITSESEGSSINLDVASKP